jgi:RimJ/RimL family protein N-acetyltransferase
MTGAARWPLREPQPELLTARLRLRRPTRADAPAVQGLVGDFAVASTTLTIPHPYPEGAAETWIESVAVAYEEGRRAVFLMTDHANGDVYGAIGLTLHLEHDRAELGYWVGHPFWGRGYATEAGKAVLAWGFTTLGLHRIHARHFIRNPASGRVLVKLGMRREGTARGHFRRWDRYEDVAEYGILREEFGTP